METIKAYKHTETGKIFESKKDYDKCKKEYDLKQAALKKKQEFDEKFESIINQPRLEATSITDFIERWVKTYNEYHAQYGLKLHNVYLTGLSDVKQVRCTHSCPIGEKTNWNGGPDSPTSYLGVTGSIKGNFIRNKDVADIWHASFYEVIKNLTKTSYDKARFPGLHTGSGNGGENFNMEVSFFIQDFPKLQKEVDRIDAIKLELEPLHIELTRRQSDLQERLSTRYSSDPLIDIYNTSIKSIVQQKNDAILQFDIERKQMVDNIVARKIVLENELKEELKFPEDLIQKVQDLKNLAHYKNIF